MEDDENYRIIGACPHCFTWRIQVWNRPNAQWRCQECERTFRTPRTLRFNVGGNPHRYILAEDIPRLERLVSYEASQSKPSSRRGFGSGFRAAAGLFLVIAAIAVAIGAGAFLGLFDPDSQEPDPQGFTVALVPTPTPVSAPAPTPNLVVVQSAPSQAPTPTPSLVVVQSVPSQEPTPTSTPAPVPTPIIVPTRIPTPIPTPTPIPPAHLRHHEEKLYMLELINQARAGAGVPPVVLGENHAAQLHAEAGLDNCFGSHWGVDGLKPYMRYSLAGGYQSNGENWLGSDYCITWSDGYRAIQTIEQEIREAMQSWMDSPGHRRNILDKWHKKVNIGLAWDTYNFNAAQHFEGDYVEYDTLPAIDDSGVLLLAGRVKNGARFDQDDYIDISIYYDPPPHGLTRGQLARTYCYNSGLPVAYVRKPLSGDRYYRGDQSSTTYSICPNPYDVSPDAPPARSHDEAHSLWQAAYDASQLLNSVSIPVMVPEITARQWEVSMDGFSIAVDLGTVLDVHGKGVYTVTVWGTLGEEITPISQYSIFRGVATPDTYDPDSR